MDLYTALLTTKLPVVYSHFAKPQIPPYIAYIGRGQNTFGADNTWTWRKNQYQVEYYFTQKNEANEAAVEDALLANGYNYEKSEDIFIESENVFVIYYYV